MSKLVSWRHLSTKLNSNVLRRTTSRCLSIEAPTILARNTTTISPFKSSLLQNKDLRNEITQCRYYADYPDHSRVALPALSPTMEMGTIVSWAKKEGDKLNEGDLLAEIETDKATMGFETPEEGYLAKILVPAGSKDVPIGKLVCIIVENESDVAAFKDFKDDAPPAAGASAPAPPPPKVAAAPPPPPPKAAPAPSPTPVPSQKTSGGTRVYASPLAKRLAAEKGLDLSSIGAGSGLFGSITSADLSKASKAGAVAAPSKSAKPTANGPFTDLPVSGVRGVIAKRLLQSKQTIPHYYLNVDVRLNKVIKLREQMNKALEKRGAKLSINDFIIKATALASRRVPEANSSWQDTFIREYHSVDVSVAVNTDKGLFTPIVFDADKKGLVDISNDVKTLAAKAKEGKLQPHEFQIRHCHPDNAHDDTLQIKLLLRVHNALCRVSHLTSDVFAVQILLSVASCFAYLTSNLYYLSITLLNVYQIEESNRGYRKLVFLLFCSYWIVSMFLELLFIVKACERPVKAISANDKPPHAHDTLFIVFILPSLLFLLPRIEPATLVMEAGVTSDISLLFRVSRLIGITPYTLPAFSLSYPLIAMSTILILILTLNLSGFLLAKVNVYVIDFVSQNFSLVNVTSYAVLAIIQSVRGRAKSVRGRAKVAKIFNKLNKMDVQLKCIGVEVPSYKRQVRMKLVYLGIILVMHQGPDLLIWLTDQYVYHPSYFITVIYCQAVRLLSEFQFVTYLHLASNRFDIINARMKSYGVSKLLFVRDFKHPAYVRLLSEFQFVTYLHLASNRFDIINARMKSYGVSKLLFVRDFKHPVYGENVPADFLSVTLSCDHRVIDGAVGAQWLQAFKELLETPENMLL
ncbi:uncharacterized protein LOC103512808 [Diaphorina citri]|uniref:Dihydrolipoamide acetyltransferase component of pyruvate dehydrogenase complex n=1 Tax=Diaphorina citri TaxID=121845 RepID=A0A3Q0J0I9_DIACI|nr:uncharacterized protein LOC103512808 [Diaphorina citri]